MVNEIVSAFAVFVGGVLSLAFRFWPALAAWWELKTSNQRALLMVAFNAGAALIILGASCFGLVDTLLSPFGVTVSVACDRSGVLLLIQAFIFSMISNQTTYQLVKKHE